MYQVLYYHNNYYSVNEVVLVSASTILMSARLASSPGQKIGLGTRLVQDRLWLLTKQVQLSVADLEN